MLPEEEADARSTGEGVGSAGSNVLSLHLRLAAVALRAQHAAAHQAQCGGARLIPTGPRTPTQGHTGASVRS